MNTFYAIKKDQTHVYDKNGKRLFITRLIARPLTIVQVKNQDKDGYDGLQIGIGSKKRLNKALTTHSKKANITPKYLREIKLEQANDKKVGDQVKASQVLAVGDLVDIRAKSKGRGFAGVMKRWNFAGGVATHGQSDRPRSPGSIGQGTDPGRVWKGKKMPGRMGGKYTTNMGNRVIFLDEEKNELWVTGSVPGYKTCLVRLNKVGHKDFVGLKADKKAEK